MNKSQGKKMEIIVALRGVLSVKERQEILNNGCAGMRSLLHYLDTIANEVDRINVNNKAKKAAS